MTKRATSAVLLVLASAVSLAAQSHPDGPEPVARGSLLIVGGGAQPDSLVQHFIDLAGGAGRARIAVVPMASGSAKEGGLDKVAQLEEMGADAFVLLVSREEADRPSVVRMLDGVTGIWFTGGDQERLVPILRGTRLLAAMHARREAGAVIGGTSAGAAIMPDSMITGNQVRDDSLGYYGDEFTTLARRTIHISDGFGFLPGTIIDQHFVARERHNRLVSAVLERPSLIGVGIDESTALEVMPDGRWIVRGLSQVVIYDARAAQVTDVSAAPLGAAGVRMHVLPPGGVFDPQEGVAALPSAPSTLRDARSDR